MTRPSPTGARPTRVLSDLDHTLVPAEALRSLRRSHMPVDVNRAPTEAGVSPFHGIPKLLSRLGRSLPTGIVTRAHRRSVSRLLDTFFPTAAFVPVVTHHDTAAIKPSQQPLRLAMRHATRNPSTRCTSVMPSWTSRPTWRCCADKPAMVSPK